MNDGSNSYLHSKEMHTAGHFNCPACERAALVQGSDELSPDLMFKEAFEIWIGQRVIERAGVWTSVRYVSERTERDLRQYARAAGKFFDQLRLDAIHAGHLRAYQKARALNALAIDGQGETSPWDRPAGANLIRKEVQTVIRVLRAAGAWSTHLEECFEPVAPEEGDVSRAMTPDEQHRWLHVASTREEWRIVYWWSIVALQTTAATNEMRALHLGDIFLSQGTLQVRNEGAKNKFRVRTIPLQSREVIWALSGLMERARALGANGPHHYLFPGHITADRYDPQRPMTVWGLRKPWNEVREATSIDWLTPYCLRHCAITRMAEAGVPIQVIMSFAGHMSPRMQQHYTAISMQAKRGWATAAWGTAPSPQAAPWEMSQYMETPRKQPHEERRRERRSGDAGNIRVLGAVR
jgi:integrase